MSEQAVTVATSVKLNVAEEKKKPRLLALLFCDFTSLTKDDKPNLLGVFDRIYIDRNNPHTPPFAVFVRVAEAIEPFQMTMFGPDDLPAFQIKSVPSQVEYTEGLPRQIQTAFVVKFEVKAEGVFWFDVSYQGNSLGGAGLHIQYREVEGGHSGTESYI